MTMSGGGEVVLKCLCPLLTMVIMSYTGGGMIMSGGGEVVGGENPNQLGIFKLLKNNSY